jgi:hypothetical protein
MNFSYLPGSTGERRNMSAKKYLKETEPAVKHMFEALKHVPRR